MYINSGLLKFGTTSFEIGKVDLKYADTINETFVITDGTKLATINSTIFSTGSITVTTILAIRSRQLLM